MIHVVRPDEGRVDGFRHLATGEHTRGAYFALELEAAPGEEGSTHSHDREDEAEYVVTGSREIRVEDTRIRAVAGSFVLVPRGSQHDMWTVGRETARYIHFFSPAGIEHWFLERARLRANGATDEEIAAARARHGVRHERTSPPDARPRVVTPAEDTVERSLIVRGSDTNGAYAILGLTSRPGRPPVPPHVHRGAEHAFYVTQGEIVITAADETYLAPAGTFVLVPRGTVHSHAHRGQGVARVLVIMSPPGSEQDVEESEILRS